MGKEERVDQSSKKLQKLLEKLNRLSLQVNCKPKMKEINLKIMFFSLIKKWLREFKGSVVILGIRFIN